MMLMRILGLIALAATLVGCGGGGSDGSSEPLPPTQSASGAWAGTVSESGSPVNDIICLVTEAGDLACILFDSTNGNFAGGSRGNIQVANGNQVSGSGTSYAAPGFVLADGSSVGNFTITGGTVSERNTLELSITSAGADFTVSAAFDAIYDRDSSLATVAGSYSAFDVFGDPASFSIDSNGVLFAQTQSGCVGNGQVNVIDPQFNSYEVEIAVSNCSGLNGSYEGLAVTTDFNVTNDVFLFGVFNSTNAIFGAPVK